MIRLIRKMNRKFEDFGYRLTDWQAKSIFTVLVIIKIAIITYLILENYEP